MHAFFVGRGQGVAVLVLLFSTFYYVTSTVSPHVKTGSRGTCTAFSSTYYYVTSAVAPHMKTGCRGTCTAFFYLLQRYKYRISPCENREPRYLYRRSFV